MPIQNCSKDGSPGYKWGESGTCYTYSPGSEASRNAAKKKALAQGIAMGDIEVEKNYVFDKEDAKIYRLD